MPNALSRLDRITVNPKVSHGKPTVRGMRFRVQDVLELLASGMTYEEILVNQQLPSRLTAHLAGRGPGRPAL